MKKGFIIPLFLIVPMILLNAQTRDANVSFDFEVHNFGKIKEVDGPVTVKFQFTNTGSQPLLIKGVRTSCGCTSPDWSKEPILPGKTGFVSATYNPKNRPGPFSKTVTVSSNASTPTKVLTIKGNVEPKPQTLEDVYRYNMGNKIRLKTNHMSFSRVVKDKTGSQQVEIVNVSDQPVQISFDRVPKHLKLVAKPETLKPGEKGLIDGILFPYRRDSKTETFTSWQEAENEITNLKKLLGPSVPVIIYVYASRHSRIGISKPEFVREVMKTGRRAGDGVIILRHQKKGTDKWNIIKKLFNTWAEQGYTGPKP